MSIIIISGSVAFITSFIGLLPQIFKALKTKSTQDISMLMLINYLLCSLAWIIYGGYTDSLFVLTSNVVGLVVSLMLIMLKRHYDARVP
ncbi:SemiSWEET family sugar transporter [Legionella israelensis]|uniref:MtN3/saliva family protein n=1 Tax=Legionella israelensis TaxID=454 RepID=A0A0W0V7B6_9GAMM|nr:SemiSWEET family transporter [Legionella israelensis]KTD16034.1 MtN3/saliva family protein [Legionella israelensis]QBS08834.1 PQ-loop repeat-containing protein [Legionella israelensis]SCY05258.1 MtN3 and saliva related transmembrane protein [Legionella israelensis DSM 19235]